MKSYPVRPFFAPSLYAALVWLGAGALTAEAQDFADMNIMELLNEPVTSVSKKESPFEESAAAIFVINQEDIRRSGLTSLPELFRLVPGANVARVHSNEWAVSVRGFNDQYANKLLVLIDGRSVYSPMFGGVYWNAQDMILEDLDRIEVIRGPGATLWGANAVNGVVNITSKSAKETQGALITSSYGTEDERPMAGVRYGGQIAPNIYYRTYVKTFDRRGFEDNHSGDDSDAWDMTRVGSRVDWETASFTTLTLQAEYYQGTVGEHFDGVTLTPPFQTHQNVEHDNFGGNVIARLSHYFSPDSQLTIQAYYDRYHQGDGDIAETRNTFDLEVQHNFALGDYNNIVWGVGSRYTEDRLTPTFYLTFDPETDQEQFYSAFVQDEITLVPKRLKLTLGSKFEHGEEAGFTVQPSARLAWTPTPRQTVWTAVSRAVRVPARYDRDARLNTAAFQAPGDPPVLIALISEDNVDPETLNAFEAGYRFNKDNRLSFDLTAFYNQYDGILAYVPGTPFFENTPAPAHLVIPLYFQNALSGDTYGTEVAVRWRVTEWWKLIAGYSWLHMRLHPQETPEGQNSQHQYQLRSYFDLPHNFQLNAAAYYVGSTSTPLKAATVPLDSILRVDVGLTWRPRPGIELGIWGQNLLEPSQSEFGSFKKNTLSEIPRSYSARVIWEF
ncbi:MAG: TonB-dependent receptor, plug [Rariglobus sp.]|nr:TonB-dependent receptor, plug [Rariglobus sp.]